VQNLNDGKKSPPFFFLFFWSSIRPYVLIRKRGKARACKHEPFKETQPRCVEHLLEVEEANE